jgi:hypothetical protein
MKLARSTYYDEPELQPLGEAPISRIALVSAFLTGGLRSFLIFRAPSRSRRSTGFDPGCGLRRRTWRCWSSSGYVFGWAPEVLGC